jgi:phage head maturation protease
LGFGMTGTAPSGNARPGQATPPRKRPRGVEIEEVSLVSWPAYLLAGVTALAVRTAADQRRHEESERIIREWERAQIQRAHEQRMRAKTT